MTKVCLTWVKNWVLLIVLFKICVLLKKLFDCVFSNHNSCNKKAVCWEKQKIYEKMWVVFEHGKMVFFWFVFFWGFNGFVVCFCVSGIVAKVLKMLVFFPVLGVLCGGLFLLIWVWKVYVFCGSCFWFSFVQVLFLFVLVLVLFCCWVVVGVVFVCFFFVVFVFLVLVFWRVLWATSLGPKPSLFFYFFCFVFIFWFFCFCLEGLRVKWGGPKGHLTWP